MSQHKNLPSPPLLIDQHIAKCHGVDVRIATPPNNATPHNDAQPSKPRGARSNLQQRIERSETENATLLKELQCQRKKESASMIFLGEVRDLAERLLQAANIYEDVRIDIDEEERERLQHTTGVVDNSRGGSRGTAPSV